jgi:hypothetical protein
VDNHSCVDCPAGNLGCPARDPETLTERTPAEVQTWLESWGFSEEQVHTTLVEISDWMEGFGQWMEREAYNEGILMTPWSWKVAFQSLKTGGDMAFAMLAASEGTEVWTPNGPMTCKGTPLDKDMAEGLRNTPGQMAISLLETMFGEVDLKDLTRGMEPLTEVSDPWPHDRGDEGDDFYN